MRGKPFVVGNTSGEGRPLGSRNKRTVFAEMMESHGEAVIKQCQVLAMKGDPTALRLCIERLVAPCKSSTKPFRLPSVKTTADVGKALQAVLKLVARGRLSAQEGEALAAILDNQRTALETEEFAMRLRALEEKSREKS